MAIMTALASGFTPDRPCQGHFVLLVSGGLRNAARGRKSGNAANYVNSRRRFRHTPNSRWHPKYCVPHANRAASLGKPNDGVRYRQIRCDLAHVASVLEDPQAPSDNHRSRNDIVVARHTRPITLESLFGAYRVAMPRFDGMGREVAMHERHKLAMLQAGHSPGQRRLPLRVAHCPMRRGVVILFWPAARRGYLLYTESSPVIAKERSSPCQPVSWEAARAC